MWIASSEGLSRRSIQTGLYQSFQETYRKPEFTKSVITKIHCDSQGKLWLGTWADGIYLIDPETGVTEKFSIQGKFDDIITTGHVSAIVEGPKGSVWISG